jgi:hypothetical protein
LLKLIKTDDDGVNNTPYEILVIISRIAQLNC